MSEREPIAVEERVLTEVDHLLVHRRGDGSYDGAVLADLLVNLETAANEAAMPFAVTEVAHDVVETEHGRRIYWLGKTAVENAMSGYRFHKHQAARDRVDIEVAKAADDEERLRPGVMKIIISPRMSESDAPYEVAKQEHLGADDSIQASWLLVDQKGKVQKRLLQSLLVRDVPLQAWVDMLQDPNNVFGKPVAVANSESARAVMDTHKELELPLGALPGGVVDLVQAVVPYIRDEATQRSVRYQVMRYQTGQAEMKAEAQSIATRWQQFEIALAESLYDGVATADIERFIVTLQDNWSEADLNTILSHQTTNGHYMMSRQLAIVLERAKRNMLWTFAGVATGNETVIAQVDPALAERIVAAEHRMLHFNEQLIHSEMMVEEADLNRGVATANVKVGTGCVGDSEAAFKRSGDSAESSTAADKSKDKSNWEKKQGTCVVKNCPTRPGKVTVGPCGVCMGRCQKLYDAGKDPSSRREKPAPPKESAEDAGRLAVAKAIATETAPTAPAAKPVPDLVAA